MAQAGYDEGGAVLMSGMAARVCAMAVCLAALAAEAVKRPEYCVIDLAGGSGAAEYPVSFLAEAPAEGWTEEYKTTRLVLKRVEPGMFTMTDGAKSFPEVVLTNAYYLGVFEVTQRQWELVTGTRPSYFSNDSYYGARPVEQVGYDRIADGFIAVLNTKCGGLTVDLPTEAQWEFACRAGTTGDVNLVGAEIGEVARYRGNGGEGGYDKPLSDLNAGTAAVGSYAANAWGFYDMLGNVEEWCRDWYGALRSGVTEPSGPDYGTYRVRRGGQWYNAAAGVKCSTRGKTKASDEYSSKNIGFRLKCAEVEVDLDDITIAEAVEAPELVFENDADKPWTVVFDRAKSGGWASAKSGAIGNKEETTLITRVKGEGVFSFWWKASSEWDEESGEFYDYAIFSIDGVEMSEIGGETDWEFCRFEIGPGDHELKWVYQKDKRDSAGEDCVWLDEVSWMFKKRALSIMLK